MPASREGARVKKGVYEFYRLSDLIEVIIPPGAFTVEAIDVEHPHREFDITVTVSTRAMRARPVNEDVDLKDAMKDYMDQMLQGARDEMARQLERYMEGLR